MTVPENNLLLRLHKWAWRQDENFLTEALAHLLQHLLGHEPEAAVGLLRSITGGFLTVLPETARSVIVRTQVFTAEGTPDLELRTPRQRAIVEVKSESGVNVEQLRRYRHHLQGSGIPSALILLTRYPVGELEEKPYAMIRWYQVAAWLAQERTRYAFKAVSEHLVNQFLGFLTGRNMTMGQVTWDMPSGVRALRTLNDMLYEIASATGLQVQPYGNRSWLGVYLDKRAYCIGIYYDHPEVLLFETDNRKVDKEAAERLGIDGVHAWQGAPGYYWQRALNLEAEEIHFFARSNAGQMQLLEQFLGECLDTVKRIEIRGGEEASDLPAEADLSDAGSPSSPSE